MGRVTGKRSLGLIENEDIFTFWTKNGRQRVKCDHIVFFESDGHYVLMHTNDKNTYKIRSMMRIVEDVMDDRFLRVHRGILINLKYVNKISKNDISLGDIWGRVPVSRSGMLKLKEMVENKQITI